MKAKKYLFLTLAVLSLWQLSPMATAQIGTQQTQVPAQSPTTPPAKWTRYTYSGDEFSVELPEMPFVFNTTRSISETESEKLRVFGLYSSEIVFMLVSYDKPRSSESMDYFADSGWKPTPVGDIKLGGYAGRKYEISYQGSITLHGVARVFRTKRHAYLVQAFFIEAAQPAVERFLNSFTLGARPSVEAIADDGPGKPSNPSQRPPGGMPSAGTDVASAQPTPDTQRVDGSFSQKEVTRKAFLVYKPEPRFTEEARKNNVTGVVRLRVVLSSDGKVKSISVIKGLPDGLTEQAIIAANHLLFFPAQKDGRLVSQYIVLEYNFNIY